MLMDDPIFEPGSQDSVLKNIPGITSERHIEIAETVALKNAADELLGIYDAGHRFTADDICFMHKVWLSGIYEWAGNYRRRDMEQNGISFAPPKRIEPLMKAFEAGPLQRHTPCNFKSADRVVKALSEVCMELYLIHPFIRGNSRLARLLATLMAAQAGLPLLDFSDFSAKPERYRNAMESGLQDDLKPMEELFGLSVRRSMKSGSVIG
jgi:cell filamentation protein